MSVEKSKETSAKKVTTETKGVEAKTELSAKTENKSETPAQTDSKPDVKPKKQDMGEGQKAVSKAYKDNWNDIFAKKKKR
jgi:hypothetical protein